MQVCSRCGEENPERAKFCLNCAAPLQAEPHERREVRKVVTLVFTDVSGSTAMGEQLDPESLRRIMARYFETMRAVITKHEGTVEKFVGDAVLAVFGIPTLHEDDALRGVRAAFEMRSALQDLNRELEAERGVTLKVRTGVNTGEVVAGDLSLGEEFVTGDAVNVAARLEQNAPVGEILLGPQTYRLVRNAVEVESVEPLSLKGKTEPFPAYRLLSIVADAAGFARRLDAPLVGRSHEMQLLQQAFERSVRESSCHLFTILGSAGVGKSRLVAEFLGRAEGEARVLRGRCLPYGEGITYWPLIEVIREATGAAEGDVEKVDRGIRGVLAEQRDMERVFPFLLQIVGAREGTAGVEELGWGLRRFFETLATTQPTIVVLDDIHWGEPALLDTIEYLADWSRDAPILILCIARPELLDARAGWGGGKMNATSLLLESLSPEESDELVTELLGHAGLPDEIRYAVAQAAEGNPLFVEQMLEMLIDEGFLEAEGDHWSTRGSLEGITVPPTINALICARLDRLQSEERQVIERASVIGKTFYTGAIRHLSPASAHPEVRRHLMTLIRKELVRPDQEGFGDEDAFRFRHILIRDAAYDSISKEIRAELHLKFAEWLEGKVGDQLITFQEILAHHLAQAHRYKKDLGASSEDLLATANKAARHFEESGRRALGRSDYSAATKLFRAGLALEPSSTLRIELVAALADVVTLRGQLAEALDLLSKEPEPEDELNRARLAIVRAAVGFQVATMTPEETRRSALDLLPVFEASGDARWQCEAWITLMMTYNALGNSTGQIHAAEQALHFALEAGDKHHEAAAREWLGAAHAHGVTPVGEVIAHIERDLELVTDSVRVEGFLKIGLAHMLGEKGLFDEARATFAYGSGLLKEVGLGFTEALTSQIGGYIERMAQDPEAAERALLAGKDQLEAMGEKGYLSTSLAELAAVYCDMERWEEAEETALYSRDITSQGDAISEAGWRVAMGRVKARRGEADEARRLANQAIEIIEGTDFLSFRGAIFLDAAKVWVALGDLDAARESLAKARRDYSRKEALAGVAAVERFEATLT